MQDLIIGIGGLVKTLIVIVAGIALLVFLWGLAKFVLRAGGDEKAISDGKNLMIWGVIALFVMVSTWGIVHFLQYQLELPSTAPAREGEEYVPPWIPPSA